MQSAHFFIWCGITVLVVGFSVLAWSVIQLRRASESTSEHIDRVLAQLVASEAKVESLQAWASSWVPFQEQIAKSHDAKVDEINKRLISIETENKNDPPAKHSDDPFDGPRSWSAVASSIERAEGVRL